MSEHNRGTAFGFYGLIIGICLLIGHIIFGFLWDNYDISIAVFYSLTLSLLTIIFMLSLIKKFLKMAIRNEIIFSINNKNILEDVYEVVI